MVKCGGGKGCHGGPASGGGELHRQKVCGSGLDPGTAGVRPGAMPPRGGRVGGSKLSISRVRYDP